MEQTSLIAQLRTLTADTKKSADDVVTNEYALRKQQRALQSMTFEESFQESDANYREQLGKTTVQEQLCRTVEDECEQTRARLRSLVDKASVDPAASTSSEYAAAQTVLGISKKKAGKEVDVNAQSKRQMTIKMNVVKRLTKELSVYRKESETETSKLEQMKSDKSDESAIATQSKLAAEAQRMVPHLEERLQEAATELGYLLETPDETIDPETIQTARSILQAAK